ncbi:MAG: tRNA preQ1(34) S-adenosylmethionine ribosyltransferase-isomerase QueA [Acetobacteraceae bacterium]
MRLSDFSFELPPELIAQHPASPKSAARLLVIGRDHLEDHVVAELPGLLRPGDIVVANDTRVIPARLEGRRGAARIGITLDRPTPDGSWSALARNARRLRAGDRIDFAGGLSAEVLARATEGSVTLRFSAPDPTEAASVQLPPYITRPHGPTVADKADYQTIFAARPGAVAAPTAGLHFTEALLRDLAGRGVGVAKITLHVGAGTFLPLRQEDLGAVRLHAERGEISEGAACAISDARAAGGRMVAVGTTTLRLLEAAADDQGEIRPFAGETRLFLKPGHRFRTADLLLTNFHLPRSSLFVLVSAFAGRERMLAAYRHAIAAGYRFYSYGDASLIACCPEE